MKKIRFVDVVRTAGISFLFSSYISFAYVFLDAYGRRGYKTTVMIDYYGEAHAELLLFLIMMPAVAYVFYWMAKSMRDDNMRWNGRKDDRPE